MSTRVLRSHGRPHPPPALPLDIQSITLNRVEDIITSIKDPKGASAIAIQSELPDMKEEQRYLGSKWIETASVDAPAGSDTEPDSNTEAPPRGRNSTTTREKQQAVANMYQVTIQMVSNLAATSALFRGTFGEQVTLFAALVTRFDLPQAQERKALRRFLLFVTQVLLPMLRDGRVLVADRGKHSIFLFEADGTLVKQMGGQGKGEGQFDLPCFVCVDEEDNIIVAEKDNSRVQVFDKNFNFQHKFGQKGRQPQNMWDPTGVSADSKGNIVLGNIGMESNVGGVQYGKKLQVFRPDGTWVSTISSEGDKLSKPHGVAVTEDGHLFVADPKDHCIRKYRYM
ncbi:hypothetical protein Bbelb_110010 [Branchiostoma belcheri]|nr:hypothetical protein Bbelb_110010 [Branchiostoma belcheri]